MQLTFLKTAALGWVAIALFSSITACSASTTSNQSPTPSMTNTGMQGMNHSSMKHGKMGDMSMDLGPANAEVDLRFIDAMTPHHQGATTMAKEAKQKSKRPEIQQLAANIIQAQDQEITQMREWRKTWYSTASETPMAWDADMGHMMAMSLSQTHSMMMSQDLGSADDKFDLRWIDAMIPHHEGAIAMAKDILNKSKRPEIQQLAKAIMTSQQAEIEQMQQWRKAWYGK